MTILENASLQTRNTMRLAASARAYAEVSSEQEIASALDWASRHDKLVVPWGAGSNVILAGDLDALVLLVCSEGVELHESSADSVLLRVAAGVNWHEFVQWSLKQGYSGLENLALIPGTIGAAPIQNIGAYGVEVAAFIDAVHGVRLDTGLPFTLTAQECQFGYRDSIFKGEWRDAALIDSVDLRLPLSRAPDIHYPALEQHLHESGINSPSPQQVFDAVVSIRSAKLPDPAVAPNAGSFFKNPVLELAQAQRLKEQFPALPTFEYGDDKMKVPAAWMIEHCGWKGQRVGGVGVHPEHALVLVNYGSDSGAEILGLAARIARDVQGAFGVELAIEPRIYGVAARGAGDYETGVSE